MVAHAHQGFGPLDVEIGIVREPLHAVLEERHDRFVMFGAEHGLGQVFPGSLPVGFAVAGGFQMSDRLGPLMTPQMDRTEIVMHRRGLRLQFQGTAIGRDRHPVDAEPFRRVAHHRPLLGIHAAPRIQAREQLQGQIVGPRLIGRRAPQGQDLGIGAAGHRGVIGPLPGFGQLAAADQGANVVGEGGNGHSLESDLDGVWHVAVSRPWVMAKVRERRRTLANFRIPPYSRRPASRL